MPSEMPSNQKKTAGSGQNRESGDSASEHFPGCNKRDVASAGGQLFHFFLHLRWHYQVLILSGGYLLGGLLSGLDQPIVFGYHFLIVHLLLFGGATVYNSYWDKDEGPIGGLRHPPPLAPWTHRASIGMQCAGLLLSLNMGLLYVLFFMASMLFFWLYSHPVYRWKGHPFLSLAAIGISTGTNSVIMGYLAAGSEWSNLVLIPAAGTALIMLSLYPVSQVYQVDEDKKRGDRTFAVAFGNAGVYRFFLTAFTLGTLLVSAGFHFFLPELVTVFIPVAVVAGGVTAGFLRPSADTGQGYHRVMRIKYVMSSLFVLFLLGSLVINHYFQYF